MLVSRAPDDDRELDAFLARGSALQRGWREASAEAPDADVDAAVRAQARRAVGAGPGVPRPDVPRSNVSSAARWRVPLAAAATIVLGSTVVLMVAEREGHLRGTPPPQQAPAAPGTAPPTPADTTADAVSPPAAPAGRDAVGVPRDAPGMPAPPLARKSAPPAPAAAETRQRRLETPEAERFDPPPDADANVMQPQQAPAAPASAAASEDVQEAAPAEPEARLRVQPFGRGARSAAGDAAAPAPVQKDPVQADPAQADPAQADPAHTEAVQEEAAQEAADIDAWLERIRALRRQGKLQEVERSLREFRLRHPDYALPEDLAAQHRR